MSHYRNSLFNKDTTVRRIKCFFEKLPGNPFSSSLFHYERSYQGDDLGTVIFTGTELITLNTKDSIGTIKTQSFLEQNNGIDNKMDIPLYQLFSDSVGDSFLPHVKKTKDSNSYSLLRDDIINGDECYQVQAIENPEPDTLKEIDNFRKTYTYWINKKSFLLVQYAVSSDYTFRKDTLSDFEKVVLTIYNLNNQVKKSLFDIASIPSYYTLKNYVLPKSHTILPKGLNAPDFTLHTLNNKQISLAGMKGKLVLVDFFYQGCLPCVKAFPTLQHLQTKYKDKGLIVLGIDPFDKNIKGLREFLGKQGVNYTVLLDDDHITEKNYQVSSYPTIYLISKEGKIIFTFEGYGEGSDGLLDQVIRQNL